MDPIAFQGCKPWGAIKSTKHGDMPAEIPQPISETHLESESGPKMSVAVRQHFYAGEVLLRVRLPENVETLKGENVKARPFCWRICVTTICDPLRQEWRSQIQLYLDSGSLVSLSSEV